MFNHKKLKRVMNDKNILQQDLADAIGVSHVSIYNYVEGKKNPRAEIVKKISDYFGFPYEYFLTDKSEEISIAEQLGNVIYDFQGLEAEDQKMIIDVVKIMITRIKNTK
ncbi:helix-turn-helix transcriptional regulator [Bacillus sp. S13(2024)]|uniref:helix-turn-helix domain-containing protein n=1 Tax=Bacillus sp. S13(2024) TaxID=3162885 RepID=UPI003D1E3DA6